jgi:hypothetical protein
LLVNADLDTQFQWLISATDTMADHGFEIDKMAKGIQKLPPLSYFA